MTSRIILWAFAVLFLVSAESRAHGLRPPADTSGIAITPISHGQMAVIADYRNQIHVLAAWTAERDATVAKLLDFSRQQYARCLWGWIPGSVTDEASPFNECSHAYLAADQAMLLRIREGGYWPDITTELFDKIEMQMVRSGSSLVLCAFSAAAFNTASLIGPHWIDVLYHLPSLLTVALLAFAALAGVVLVVVRLGASEEGEPEAKGDAAAGKVTEQPMIGK